MKPFPRFSLLLVFFAGVLLMASTGLADTVKLKSGETLEGKITSEGSDYIKLEIAVSSTIKDTKIIPKNDIAQIIKAAADDVALSDLRKKLPAPSLMSAEAYRSLISSGPEKFLKEFPSSTHKAEVEKILADLKEELDKVERGWVKVEGDWISPQERKDFKALTDSRIRGVVMKRKLAQGDHLGALRDFEILDERYFGTPAHLEALPVVKELLPAFGQRLTRALQDVEYRNQKWEQDKGLLDEVARAQVEAARAQEVANFQRAVEREKSAGVKWLSISDNSRDSLSGAIALVKSEIERLKGIDLNALKQMSEQLVKADKLIAEEKLAEAKRMIDEAMALPVGGEGSKKGRSTSSSKKKSSGEEGAFVPSSYADALYHQIALAEEAIAVAKAQRESAAKGDEVSETMAKSKSDGKELVSDPGEAAAAEGDDAKTDQSTALAGLMGTTKKGEGGADAEGEKSNAAKKPAPKKTTAANDGTKSGEAGAEERPSPVVADEGGGLNFQLIMMIVAGLMVVAIVVMKVTGIGGKKKEDGEEA